jgi:hypothetical protein
MEVPWNTFQTEVYRLIDELGEENVELIVDEEEERMYLVLKPTVVSGVLKQR